MAGHIRGSIRLAGPKILIFCEKYDYEQMFFPEQNTFFGSEEKGEIKSRKQKNR